MNTPPPSDFVLFVTCHVDYEHCKLDNMWTVGD